MGIMGEKKKKAPKPEEVGFGASKQESAYKQGERRLIKRLLRPFLNTTKALK
jgi:hypothetical protein